MADPQVAGEYPQHGSQTCPICRLISPPGALRCDCGYDFGTGQVRGSYLAADIVEKHGGARRFLEQRGQKDIRRGALLLASGITIAALTHAIAARLAAEGSGGTYLLAWVPVVWGVVLLLRGLNQRHATARAGQNDAVPDIAAAVDRMMSDVDWEWLLPPREVHASEPWDRYWRAQVEHGVGLFNDMFIDDRDLIDLMAARGLSSVLCVGNGLSLEPHALAAAGLKVTALDISPWATELARSASIDTKHLGRYVDPARTRPGGTVEFVAGDLTDSRTCPGPYDVVIERRTLQIFPEAERTEALRAVASRMSSHGILFTHCHDGGWKPPQPPSHAIEPLLVECGFATGNLRSGSTSAHGRTAFVFTTTG